MATMNIRHNRVSGAAANPNALVDGPAWDDAHAATFTQTGGTSRLLSDKLSDIVSVKDFGAVCDGVTDDSAAINAALAIPNSVVVIPAGKACRVASTILINPAIGTTLRGADFDAGAYPSPTSARIVGDLTLSPVVSFIGAANGTMTLENIAIGRAAGTPGSSTVGLYIQDGYNVVLRNVLSYNHGIPYSIKGQVFNNSAGISLIGDGIFAYGAVDAYLVMDSWAELKLSHCRFGRSAAAGDYSCTTFFRVKGGVSGTAGGPNTLYVKDSQFNQNGTIKVKHLIEFVQVGSGGVGAIDATEFVFDGCHVEGLETTGNGGSAVSSDSSWNLLDRFEVVNSLFNTTATSFFGLNAATALTNIKIVNSSIYAADMTLAPTGAITGLMIDGNWLQTPLTITPGSGGAYGSVSNNGFFGNYTVSGAWTRFSSVGNTQVSGSRSVAPTGTSLIADNGFPLQQAVGSLASRTTNNLDTATAQVAIFEGARATPTNNDTAYLSYQLSDSGGTQKEAARDTWKFTSVTAGSETVQRIWSLRTSGAIADKLFMQTTLLAPVVNDGLALGSSSTNWSDLFLASGAVINYNNSNVTITHAANALTTAGGKHILAPTTTTYASFNIPVGTAPTSPTDGDMWREDNTNTGLKVRINGVTKTVSVV